MNTLLRVLCDLAEKHVSTVRSGERDCRLIFPGLTDSLAVELHKELRYRITDNVAGSASGIPVYLALDSPGSRFDPDKSKGWLHYEAVTSVRQGSFVTVCMPRVLPKLHDSIRGTGSPIRGLTFGDEWPWRDDGMEAFRFAGPVLDAILDMWTPDPASQRWLRALILEGLIPDTAPLRDEVRVSLLLDEILGSFEPTRYPKLDDVVDKFCFHCGIPRVVSREKVDPADHIDAIERTAKALHEQRTKNPEFRDYLVNDVAESTFASLEPDRRQHLQRSLDLLLDGALELGAGSGLLGYHGGLGNGSSSRTIEAWSALDVDRLRKLFGLGGKDVVQCTAFFPDGNGVVSTDGKHVAIFEGVPLALNIEVKISPDRFVSGDFHIRCKRLQRQLHAQECIEAEFQSTVTILPNELPGTKNRLSLVVQLVRFQQAVSETRISVHVCGTARPGIGVFKPGFDVVNLLESAPDSTDSESVMVPCREPVRLHVLDWRGTDLCRVTADDEVLPLDIEYPASGESGPTQYALREAIDVESFSGARIDLRIEASDLERDVTLSGEDIEPGEFTLEDELRVAVATAATSRLRRVLPFFRGDGDLVLPKLGEIDAAARRRMILGRLFEEPDGWKPVLVDFLEAAEREIDAPVPQPFCRTTGSSLPLLTDMEPTDAFDATLTQYAQCRDTVIQMARTYVQDYATPSERPLYIVAPTYVARDDPSIETAISQYLDAYSAVLNLLRGSSLSPGEVFTFVHLDSVVLERAGAADRPLDLRVSLLGPWHPLVVAKRFMVQHWIYAAANESGWLARQYRRLASLFERTDGFRVVPGFDADSLGLDLSFAFPTSDPGWHITVASGAFSALGGSTFGSLRGLGQELRRSLGLRSSLYLAATDLWSESFVRSFHRSHPSRRQLGIRVSRGLDARPVVDSCVRLLGDQRGQSGRLGALLPGGIHLFLEERLDDRRQLPWQQPGVFVYEALEDDGCYDKFHPDILLLPQREETRLVWLPDRTDTGLAAPRGRDRGAVFSMPLVDLGTDHHGLPVSRILESGTAGGTQHHVAENGRDGDFTPVGEGYRRTLASIDELARQVRPQRRPALVQDLGLPRSLRSDWTVLPGAHVHAGALTTYIASRAEVEGEERALWDYRLDVGRSVRSYFIVCKVPKSVLSSLAARSLALKSEDSSSALRELAEVGFAVGETMRSGKAAVGVLGVVGALRLARAAWAADQANGRRWCTILLPVDCITELMLASGRAKTPGKRADLLAINLSWSIEGRPALSISPCAVECKYVSAKYPASAVQEALGQAEATYQVVTQLLSLALSEGGMHARLALCRILQFGLRLLVARQSVTIADEKTILDATLVGSFDVSPPIAPTLLVTTSCGATGDGTIDVLDDGWWVRLTADCWPREVPSPSNPLVQQLSEVFPAVELHTDDGGTMTSRGANSTIPSSVAGARRLPRSAGQDDGAPSTVGAKGEGEATRSSRAEAREAPDESNEQETDTATALASVNLIHPAFDGFVGNTRAVEALSIQLRYLEKTGARTIRSVGLFGPKSTGKTELSRRLASALDVPYLPLSETGLGDIDQLASRMQERVREAGTTMPVVGHEGGQPVLRSPPMLVFIDEVHQLRPRVQDTLLPVLEADDRTLRGSRLIIDARDVSFVIATTDWGKLREPFRSRVRAVMLDPYNADEVAQMLRYRIEAASPDNSADTDIDPAVAQLDEDALVAVATAARAVPRVALDLLREIGMALRIRVCGPGVDSVWKYLRKMVPCDRQGLTSRDRKYLRIVAKRGPIGVDNIATELGTDRSNVEGAIEPFLAQMGWLKRGSTGRMLTTSGRRLVARFPRPVD